MTTISRTAYPGDLTEAQAQLFLPLIPPAKEGGRPRSVDIVSKDDFGLQGFPAPPSLVGSLNLGC